MAKFGLKTLAIFTAVVALWLSSFANFPGAGDIRAFIIVTITVASGVAAVSLTGRRRAFWGGFCASLVLMCSRTLAYAPRWDWVQDISRELGRLATNNSIERGRYVMGFSATLGFLTMLVLAAVIGVICVYVYDQCRPKDSQDRTPN